LLIAISAAEKPIRLPCCRPLRDQRGGLRRLVLRQNHCAQRLLATDIVSGPQRVQFLHSEREQRGSAGDRVLVSNSILRSSHTPN
jgi:hypothetical protein